MDIYIYSDESGVFDSKHNKYFVFGGLVCFGKSEKDVLERKFIHAERAIAPRYQPGMELKASRISNKDKGKLFRCLNGAFKFCVLIHQRELNQRIFQNKRHKQRYLDYAYKIVLKKCLESLVKNGFLKPKSVENMNVYCDEHHTATDGKYELRESLLAEFKYGVWNPNWDGFIDPLFWSMHGINVFFCDSKKVTLVRAADIIANHCYHSAVHGKGAVETRENLFVYVLPSRSVLSKGLEYFQKQEIQPALASLLIMPARI